MSFSFQVSQESGPKQNKAKGILKLLVSKVVVVFGHILHDILLVCSLLSCRLQKEDAGVYDAHEQIQAAVVTINKYRERQAHNKILQLLTLLIMLYGLWKILTSAWWLFLVALVPT